MAFWVKCAAEANSNIGRPDLLMKFARGIQMLAPSLGLFSELIPFFPKALVLVGVNTDPMVLWLSEPAIEVRTGPGSEKIALLLVG